METFGFGLLMVLVLLVVFFDWWINIRRRTQ